TTQPAVKEFHSPPDEGTRRSHPFPEGKSTDAKDPEGNIQPVGKALPSTSLDEDIRKTSYEKELGNQPLILSTSADVQALLLSDEEFIEESKDDVFKAGDEIDEDIHHTDKKKPILKRYDNVLPLTERKLVKYLQNVSQELYDRLTEDQWEKHEEATASYADLNSEIKRFHDATYKVHKGT
nr:hypothetical protein [Tanacetum cinerariifolium]